MKQIDCGLIRMKYIDGKETVSVTGKEFNRNNKEEILCYFKGGIVDFVPIKNLMVSINGVMKKLNTAMTNKEIIVSEDRKYIKLAKGIEQ